MHPEPTASETRGALYAMVTKDLATKLRDSFLPVSAWRLLSECLRICRVTESAAVRCDCCRSVLHVPVGGAVVSLRGLARRLRLSHTTVHRCLARLQRLGALARDVLSRCHTVVKLAIRPPAQAAAALACSRGVPGLSVRNNPQKSLFRAGGVFRSKTPTREPKSPVHGTPPTCTSAPTRARSSLTGIARVANDMPERPPTVDHGTPLGAVLAGIASRFGARLEHAQAGRSDGLTPDEAEARRQLLLQQAAQLMAREALAAEVQHAAE